MTPFYFGSSKRPLFGVYHPPQARPVRETGVVLCAPVGHEYVRAHRLVRSLAGTLAKSGFHVLRFDYSGCGDSSGDAADATLASWIEDVGTALDELKDTSGVSKVSLVGIRLGATLALLASRRRKDVEGCVLWDPVVDGATYLSSVEALHHAFLAAEYPPPTGEEEGDEGLLGLAVGARMRADLAALDLASTAGVGARAVALLTSEERPEYGRLRDALAAMPLRSTHLAVDARADWDDAGRIIATFLPQQMQPAIQEVVSFVTAGAS
jgi:pimeloyl-ACP methyl ester carboxylesterase